MDIVQRLRRPVNPPICDEAADEIERLREANKCLDSARTVLMPLLQEEAARYRWLRDEARSVDWSEHRNGSNCAGYVYHCRSNREAMDAAIDAAMAREA